MPEKFRRLINNATEPMAARLPETTEFDHTCCWIERWPQLMTGADAMARQH